MSETNENKRKNWGHIGRIMETELDEKLEGEPHCTACKINNEECQVYSESVRKQVSMPGSG